ncbi:MAG: aldose epimerase family protein [Flavobacteriaceae bacterium]
MKQFTIKNTELSLTALDYGAVIQKLMFRDKNGNWRNLVASLKDPEEYFSDKISLGATVGRFAGRISSGGFRIGNEHYKLFTENGVHLHGGKAGFGKKIWKVDKLDQSDCPSLQFSYLSRHLEEGYPGELKVIIRYTLKNNTLIIEHEAITDRPTIVNLTNHSYFRLDDRPDIDHYHLQLGCDTMLETDDKLMPTGKLIPTVGTDLDFRKVKKIRQVRMDTPFVCSSDNGYVGEVYSDTSGIRMRVTSNQPAVVVYTPPAFAAICFETQNYPDAPNIDTFPSSLLKPGETYLNKALFEFDLVT